ncbi:hypothetical protein B0A48_15390 [Cryoendolithus antarcticus]|uniref:Conserved oligomeric Golgi complex subunit 1 n=1 Tax=Cryoendolithus antarcticus TaxID=1507870 RepID=A0A1V8SHU6_9PEZI|nr:hypothetical protein B0A48_15390 [Cryoendolithus antarcticus]
MAPPPPDPSTLPSWEAAFAHPLPVVRSLHTQLTSQISSNREKLRSLVGSSYRDLLSTADKIIEMETQIRTVESNLGNIGRGCDSRIVTGRIGGERWDEGRDGERGRLERIARVKVAKGGIEAVGRIVRRGGNALVAAKVLGVVRLLLTSLDGSEDHGLLVKELGRRVTALKGKLLRHIDSVLVKPGTERGELVKALCAHAMITSSNQRDVLQHFLELRLEALETKSQDPSQATVLEMLELYSNTILEARDAFTRRLAEGLAQLSKAPLLQDPEVSSLTELGLDVHGRWIPENIRTYTYSTYSTSMATSDVDKGLQAWSSEVQRLIMRSVTASLAAQTDIKAVLDFRHAVLMKFFVVSVQTRNEDPSPMFDKLRAAISMRTDRLLAQATQLQLDLTEPGKLVADTHQPSVWTLAAKPLDSTNGAATLRKAVIDQRHGRDEHVQRVHSSLASWSARIEEHWAVIATMRTTKWETDDLDFDLDDVGYEGDAELRALLNKDDPRSAEERLRLDTTQALGAAYKQIAGAAKDGDNAAYHLRVLRELEARTRALGSRVKESPSLNASLHASLYEAIAKQACEHPLREYRAALENATQVVSTLWDGSPPLPMQPSPATFKFLTALQRSMAGMGEDLWSRDAVDAVRRHISAALAESFDGGVEADKDATGEKDDETEKDETAEQKFTSRAERAATQRSFDIIYLQHPLSHPSSSPHPLDAVRTALQSRAQLDEAAQQRLQKSAKEYWKKTYLLFGLLAAREQ